MSAHSNIILWEIN